MRRGNCVRNCVRTLWTSLEQITGCPLHPKECKGCSTNKANIRFDTLKSIDVRVELLGILKGGWECQLL